MDRNSVWGWIIGIVVIILIVAGAVWWSKGGSSTQANDMASTTTAAANSTASAAGAAEPITLVDRSNETVAQVVAGLSGISEYQSMFNATGIGATLIGTNPSSYTVFVSTDMGYGLLQPGTIRTMTAADQKHMIQYSVVSGRALDVQAVSSGEVQTLSGDTLNFHVGTTGLVQANSSFALAAYKAKNGIVYVINQPLLPPQK